MLKYKMLKWCDHVIKDIGVVSLSALSFNNHCKRRITIVNGLHGDELSSFLFLRHFIENEVETLDFRIDIIPFVNWLGHLEGTRNYAIGDINFNLVDVADSEEINSVLNQMITFASGSDLVIDFHNWDTLSILFGISFNQNFSLEDLALRFISNFGCPFIWRIDENQKFEKTLGFKLKALEQPYCAIELPRPDHITHSQFKDFSVLLHRAIRDFDKDFEGVVPIFGHKRAFLSQVSGVYAPEKYPGDIVEEGDIVGTIFNSVNFKTKEHIFAPEDGIVVHSNPGEYVQKNQVLGFVGSQA
jgi:predicted deacylase